ncbi:MAG TPA: acyl-CoA dehydrogenase [Spirochaetota bacterium]|nr:acyl-CoA dehydrogenase [Spirochaetota bacterium]HPV40326.1 acyl-CoA dehydrogenase [Spirochaetota bacterium]
MDEAATISSADVRSFLDLAYQFSAKSLGRMFEKEGPDGDLTLVPDLMDTAFKIGLAASPDPAAAGHDYGIWGAMTEEAGAAPSALMLAAIAETCAGAAMCLHAQGVAANLLAPAAGTLRLPRTPIRAALAIQEGPFPFPFAAIRDTDGAPHGVIRTEARAESGGYRITGRKDYVYSITGVDTFAVFTRLSGGLACFAVPADTSGLSLSDAGLRTGLRACPLHTVALNDVFVPAAARIDDGDAAGLVMRALALSWTGMAAIAVGIARGAANSARRYAAERYQGGAIIERHPAVKMLVGGSESKANAVMAALAALRPADPASPPFLKHAAELKLAATRQCAEAVSDCLQVFGGYGYMEDFGMEKRLRDATVLKSAWGPPYFLKQFIFDLDREV